MNKLRKLVSEAKSLQHYIARYRLQYDETKGKLMVDALLLLCAIAIPVAMLGWHNDSRQKQLTRLPISQQTYKDGWQMFKAKGQISLANEKNNKRYPVTQKGWVIQCGHLQQSPSEAKLSQNEYTKITYQDNWAKNKGAIGIKLLCEDGAQASNAGISLKTRSLTYQNLNAEHKISTNDPLSIEINEATIHSERGGVIQSNGDIRLIKNITFNAPGITINAQKQAQLKNYADKKQQTMLLEKGVLIQYENDTKKYKGEAELAEVIACQEKNPDTNKNCQIFGENFGGNLGGNLGEAFGAKSIRRVMLKKKVVIKEYLIQNKNKNSSNPVWTLMAQSIIIQGKQARYKGSGKKLARIIFADGTEVAGQKGGHSIKDNSGILCGAVKVRLGEVILKSPCLRYNLSKQQFKLESKKLEKELAQRFFKLNS